MPLATLWPHLVSGLVPLRRTGTVNHHLEAAWDIAERLDEPLRRLPVLSAFAERMWLTGTPDDRVTALTRVEVQPATAWAAGDLAVWLWRLGLEVPVETDSVSEPYRLTLTGRHRAAADWWRAAGAVFEEAMANADAAEVQGIERLDLLGATAVADWLRQSLRQQGVAQLLARPRASTRANPAGLTNRQLDVAMLVARGFTNAEIADRLFISVKTADHHVSAVLTKLGVPNRRAVVMHAGELGFA
jgi:DNA-binding CsgD family transcriptional regulator